MVAQEWADWLHNPCRMGGCQTLHMWVQNQQWPTNGRFGYTTPTILGGPQRLRAGGGGGVKTGPKINTLAAEPLPSSGVPNAPERGTKSVVANKRALWLHYPYHLEGSVPNASEWGTKSAATHKWVVWRHNPYHLGGP